MENIEHFAHEHTLAFYEEKNDEQIKPYVCNICRLSILSCPSYTCTQPTCTFILHKPCSQLAEQVKYEHSYDPLSLTNIEPPSTSRFGCEKCGKLCQNFTYVSPSGFYNFHPLCFKPVEIKTKHKSHNEHPLVAHCRELLCRCDLCGEEHKGFFFFCQECDFWVHQDCTLAPTVLKHVSHPHRLVLLYDFIRPGRFTCTTCERKIYGKGVYFCSQCWDYRCHINCATSSMENRTSETAEAFIHLPHEGDSFPSLAIRSMIENKGIEDDKESTMEKYHNHPLVFHDKHPFITGSSSSSTSTKTCLVDQELVCNACIQPIISSPFWKCTQPGCNFVIHNICASTPSEIDDLNIVCELEDLQLVRSNKYYFCSVFPCLSCDRPCNGFGYCEAECNDDEYTIDLECVSAPLTITHASHKQHILFMTQQAPENIEYSCCLGEPSFNESCYRCINNCNFQMHIYCALLPKTVRWHKFDKHPLELILSSVDRDLSECCFCEFCEEDIDQRYWFYHCGECDQSFHIKCIPSVGKLSKVKFGGTIKVTCHPDHPLALTRMLMEGSQRCGFCKENIKGFVDDMAFHCSECEFWIHFKCARDCWSHRASRKPRRLWYEET